MENLITKSETALYEYLDKYIHKHLKIKSGLWKDY